jgi:serine/threonine protein kinase
VITALLPRCQHNKASCVIMAICLQVAREIQIHSGLVHDHIIALYGAFEDGKHVYLVQEFAPGALSYLHVNCGLISLLSQCAAFYGRPERLSRNFPDSGCCCLRSGHHMQPT